MPLSTPADMSLGLSGLASPLAGSLAGSGAGSGVSGQKTFEEQESFWPPLIFRQVHRDVDCVEAPMHSLLHVPDTMWIVASVPWGLVGVGQGG
jgi:hypothetical protein